MAQLISIRKRQTAFHPNAVQFTLQLGPGLFGVWRHLAGRKQSIFSISNVAAKQVPLSLGQINLISVSNWADLISGQEYSDRLSKIQLMPYQTVWISNADDDRQFL